jgi:hypothetical protein
MLGYTRAQVGPWGEYKPTLLLNIFGMGKLPSGYIYIYIYLFKLYMDLKNFIKHSGLFSHINNLIYIHGDSMGNHAGPVPLLTEFI